MFSQACVKNSVHRGGGVNPPWTPPDTPQDTTQTPNTTRETHPQTATAAGGMHPTGMHSCCFLFFEVQSKIFFAFSCIFFLLF